MKNSKLVVAITFAVFVLLTTAFGQTGAIKVSVPFNFSVGKQSMAAGDYRVTIVSPELLQVARVDGPGVANMTINYTGGDPNQDQTPRLVFHRYGTRLFLSEAWIGEVNMGYAFDSSAEVEYARSMHQQPTVVMARLNSK